MSWFLRFLVLGFVVALTVDTSNGARRPLGVTRGSYAPKGGARAVDYDTGDRGIVANELSSLTLLPLKIMEFFFGIPSRIFGKISQIINNVLRGIVGVEATRFLDFVAYVMTFPLTIIYWITVVPIWLISNLTFHAAAFLTWIGGSVIDGIFSSMFGRRYDQLSGQSLLSSKYTANAFRAIQNFFKH